MPNKFAQNQLQLVAYIFTPFRSVFIRCTFGSNSKSVCVDTVGLYQLCTSGHCNVPHSSVQKCSSSVRQHEPHEWTAFLSSLINSPMDWDLDFDLATPGHQHCRFKTFLWSSGFMLGENKSLHMSCIDNTGISLCFPTFILSCTITSLSQSAAEKNPHSMEGLLWFSAPVTI